MNNIKISDLIAFLTIPVSYNVARQKILLDGEMTVIRYYRYLQHQGKIYQSSGTITLLQAIKSLHFCIIKRKDF